MSPASSGARRVGVLALQGAFERHAAALAELGHVPVLVRDAATLASLAGLVLPGGESTVQLELLGRLGLEPALLAFARERRPILATCAGLILLARRVTQPEQRSLGLLDVDVARNAYGRQLDSFEAVADAAPELSPCLEQRAASAGLGSAPRSSALPSPDARPLPLVFIRAPRITRVGPAARVLARHRGEPVLVREGNITAASFHPELTSDRRVHAAVFGSG